MAYQLPALPYAYNALEPHIDEATVRLHHDKHHAAYVAGLNTALDKLAAARAAGDTGPVANLMKDVAFHSSGHILHTIYWENMAPNAGGEPKGELAAAIEAAFGSFAAFKAEFTAAAVGVKGSGWATLIWNRELGALVVTAPEQHQNLASWSGVPVLVCDVWEHAYYLKYQNLRAGYVGAWWNLVNWDNVASRLAAAKA